MLTNLTADQRRIVALCEVPRKQASLMHEIGLSHRTAAGLALLNAWRSAAGHPDDA